ncbi:MAG: metallophosphoesterase family protein [Pseudomonadota bacterium]
MRASNKGQFEKKLKIDGRRFRRIAVIADTHGPLNQEIAARLDSYDSVLHAGDLGGWGYFAKIKVPVHAVLGNNDVSAKWPRAEHDVLRTLPDVLEVQLLGGLLVIVHGHQFPHAKKRHQHLSARFPTAKAIAYGHSHRPCIDKSTTPWILNPGAAGNVRTYNGAGFISLRISRAGWRVSREDIA